MATSTTAWTETGWLSWRCPTVCSEGGGGGVQAGQPLCAFPLGSDGTSKRGISPVTGFRRSVYCTLLDLGLLGGVRGWQRTVIHIAAAILFNFLHRLPLAVTGR